MWRALVSKEALCVCVCVCVCGGFSKVTVQNINHWNVGMLKHCQHKHINYTHTVLSLHSPTLDSVICVMKSALVRALCPVWELCIRYTLDKCIINTHTGSGRVQPHARAQDCSSFTIFLSAVCYFAGNSDGAHTPHTCLMSPRASGDSLYIFFALAQAKILWNKNSRERL